jgi:copper chaperone CopZ
MVRNAFLVFLAAAALCPSVQAIAPPDRVYELDFDRLTCSICRKAIKEVLIGLDKVKSVDYDLKNYKCFVTMNGSATLSHDTVDKAFRGTKYVFRGIAEKR